MFLKHPVIDSNFFLCQLHHMVCRRAKEKRLNQKCKKKKKLTSANKQMNHPWVT